MRILHISDYTLWGGSEQQLVDLVFELNKLNTKNIILCIKDTPLEIYAKETYLSFYSFSKHKFFIKTYIKKIVAISRSEKIDLIHLHTSKSITFFVLTDLMFGLNIPAIFSKQNILNRKKGFSYLKYNYKNLKKILCVSNAVKDAFRSSISKKNQNKLKTVYDGIRIDKKVNVTINLKDKYNINEDIIVVGNIANHFTAKDLTTFIKTVNELVNNLKYKKIHFFQIGIKSKHTNEYLQLIREYNLEKHITLTGFIKDAISLLPQMDIYLMTSEKEGLPLTIYEAFLYKVPIVSTKAGGIPEAITHNYNGLLSDIKDYKNLALNLKILISNRNLQKKFTNNAFNLLFKRFTSKIMAENTLKVYEEVTRN